MGSWISSSSEDQSKVNKEFITDLNKVMIERQLHSHNQMRERMMAMQVARARELLNWVSVFYVISMTGLFFGYRRTRKPGYLFPMLPFTMVVGYQADLAYGTKLHRIRGNKLHDPEERREEERLKLGSVNSEYLGLVTISNCFTAEAEHIMQYEMDMLNLPCGLPTVSNLDLARQVEEERKKLHPNLPPL